MIGLGSLIKGSVVSNTINRLPFLRTSPKKNGSGKPAAPRVFLLPCVMWGAVDDRSVGAQTMFLSFLHVLSSFFLRSAGPLGALRGPSRGALRGLCRGLFACRWPLSQLSSLSFFFFFKTSLRVKCTFMCFQWYQLSIVRTIERDTTIPLGNPPDSPKANVCSKNI